jgi:hypothetical protein
MGLLNRASATRRQRHEAGWLETAWALYQRNVGLLLSDGTLPTGPYQVIRWHQAALERTSADFAKMVRDRAAWFNLDHGQLTVRAYELWAQASAWPKVALAEVACRVADSSTEERHADSLEKIREIQKKSHRALNDLDARVAVGLGEQVTAELIEAHRLRCSEDTRVVAGRFGTSGEKRRKQRGGT